MTWNRVFVVALVGAIATFEAYGFAEKLGYVRDPVRERAEAVQRARELDRRFVDALISRYQDTLVIAEEESRNGHNKNLKRLAASLIEARKREMAQLIAIRDGGPASDDAPPTR